MEPRKLFIPPIPLRAMILRLVMNAVKQGKFEALVYTVPSELCTDGGRAAISAATLSRLSP